MPFKRPNKFSLEFINMEDSPSYQLGDTFVVGSEVGDVVIDDPTLSPKHATFSVKNGLVSVVDHGSAEGTKLKDSLLPRGRAVILEVDDELSLGNIVIRLNGEVDESYEEPAVAAVPEATVTMQQIPMPAQPAAALVSKIELEGDVKPEPERPEPIVRAPKVITPTGAGKPGLWQRLKSKFKRKKAQTSSRKAVGGGVHRTANTIPRIFGMLIDLVWTLILWEIFQPFEEFAFVLDVLPEAWTTHALPFIQRTATDSGFGEMYGQVHGFVTSGLKELEGEVNVVHMLSLWILLRLGSTLLLGVSLGNFMAGVRSQDSVLWKRAGGFIREVLGLVTGPFLIFDLPALVSRKTLKEVLTFTTLFVPSKGAVLVSLVFFVPLSLAGLLMAPFISGLTLPEEVLFTTMPKEKRDRNKPVATAPVQETIVGSDWFGASFKLDPAKWWVLPRFMFGQGKGGQSLRPSLMFYSQSEAGQPPVSIPLALDRTFEWSSLIGPVFERNILAHSTYPTLWRYLESTKISKGSNLAINLTEEERAKFSVELQDLIATAFRLTPDTLLEHVQTYGPLIKGYLTVRASLLGLVEATADGEWVSLMFGKTPFLMFQRPSEKPVEFYIPLALGKGRVYSVSYASSKERGKLSKAASKELWNKADWQGSAALDTFSLVKVIDVLAELLQPVPNEAVKGQIELVYGAFFEAAAANVTAPADSTRKTALVRTMNNTVDVLKQVIEHREKTKQDFAKEELAKLFDRLTDLKTQLESGNAAFFGPTKPKKK